MMIGAYKMMTVVNKDDSGIANTGNKRQKEYCDNCEGRLPESMVKFESNDGVIYCYCCEECKNYDIKFWRTRGVDLIEIDDMKTVEILREK